MPRYRTPSSRAAMAKSPSSWRVQVKGSSAVGKAWAPPRPGSRSACIEGCAAVVLYGTGRAATGHDTAARTGASSGSMVSGPRMQLRPTTSAPACSARRQASAPAEGLGDDVVQYDLGDERPRLQIAPPLTLEKVAFGAHVRAMRQRIGQVRHAILHDRLARGSGIRQAGRQLGAPGRASPDDTPAQAPSVRGRPALP